MNLGSVATLSRYLKTGLNARRGRLAGRNSSAARVAQLGGLLGTVGHRLFDEDVFALLQQQFGEIKMRGRGCDNVQRVGGRSGFRDGVENARIVFGGDFARSVGLGVEDAGGSTWPAAASSA